MDYHGHDFFHRSLQLSERSPNRGHKSVVCVGGASPQQQREQQMPSMHYPSPGNVSVSVFPSSLRASSKLLASANGAAASNSTRLRQSEVDKACSFDFDYNNYNRGSAANVSGSRSAHASAGSGGDSGSNQNLRLDFDKSRSFDEDYREALLNNNGAASAVVSSSLRYLQPGSDPNVIGSVGRLRQSNSPVAAGSSHERSTTRSPQSSGSSSNNLHLPSRRTGSPQSSQPSSYGTRLCDHELTYDMLRKSPIMNFRRGDSDYELPVQLRNRETINSGGNSELNFMSNDTRIYEHPTTVLKPTSGRGSARGEEQHHYRQTAAPPPPRSSRY